MLLWKMRNKVNSLEVKSEDNCSRIGRIKSWWCWSVALCAAALSLSRSLWTSVELSWRHQCCCLSFIMMWIWSSAGSLNTFLPLDPQVMTSLWPEPSASCRNKRYRLHHTVWLIESQLVSLFVHVNSSEWDDDGERGFSDMLKSIFQVYLNPYQSVLWLNNREKPFLPSAWLVFVSGQELQAEVNAHRKHLNHVLEKGRSLAKCSKSEEEEVLRR